MSHVRDILERFEKHRFYCKLSKCEFFKTSVPFLGHVVSAEGVHPDPRKTQAVADWPTPANVSDLRSFLGLANYFRKFILGYAEMVSPLNALLSTKRDWVWSAECATAFARVKSALTSAPVLALPHFRKPFEVIADASQVALGAILLQDGRPVAFESRKLIPAERNYTTTERELLAVVHALKIWRCYLEGVKFTVVTDHEPNVTLRTHAMLSRRQARWSEFLEQFDFDWQYRAGKHNPADPLSRLPGSVGLSMLLAMRTSAAKALVFFTALGATVDPQVFTSFEADVLAGYASDPWFANAANTAGLDLTARGFWYRQGLLVLPDTPVRGVALKLCHEHPMAGHCGVAKTLELLQRHYWWPGMRASVVEHCRTCDSCQRVKPEQSAPAGKLQLMPIPQNPWSIVTMDFITDLPADSEGHTAIYVFVDKLTKMVRCVPCRSDMNAVRAAELFVDSICTKFGVPQVVISDRDPKFASAFFTHLMDEWGIDLRMSSAYHPQTDGQTERVNRVVEDMLRHYVASSDLTTWSKFLSMAEFAINNSVHASTGNTPFRLFSGYDPLTPASLLVRRLGGGESGTQRLASLSGRFDSALRNPVSVAFTEARQQALERAKQCLRAAQDRMKRYADEKRSERTLSVGDRVLLSTRNMRLKGPRKLLPRFIGPFYVHKVINPVAYALDLPTGVRMHNVFHVSLLKPYRAGKDTLPPQSPEIVDGEIEYEVESIQKHKVLKRGRSTHRYYLLRWKGQGSEFDSWEPEPNLTNCADLLREYWAKNSTSEDAPKPIVKSRKKKAAVATPAQSTPHSVTKHGRNVSAPVRFSVLLAHPVVTSGAPEALLSHVLSRTMAVRCG